MLYDKNIEKKEFTKENLDNYLKELAKEFRKLNGKTTPAEVILVGGAAVLANYGFRDTTDDIDAIIQASSAMKEATRKVGDRLGLPNDWFNADFVRTESYSPKLVQYSKYYKTYSNVLTVRTVSAEYLIAMKLRSGRRYKKDLSDIAGILMEQKENGVPIQKEQIQKAVENLYGSMDSLPEYSQKVLNDMYSTDDLRGLYQKYVVEEKRTRNELINFEKKYEGVLNQGNLDQILESLKAKQAPADNSNHDALSTDDTER